MEYKGSFIKTILLLFLVIAIVTVIQGRPAGSSKEVLQRDDGKDGDATEGTAKKVEQLDDNVEVLQRDDGKDGDEHRHARCQNCHVIHGMPSVSHEGGCKKCHFVHLRPLVIHRMPSVSPEEMLQRDVVNDGDGGCKKCHFVHLRPLVYCKKCLETAPEIAKMLQRDVVNDGDGGCKKCHFVHLRPLVYCNKCLETAPEIAKMVQPGSDVIQERPSKRPEASQVANFEVAQLDGEKDFVERHHEVQQRSGIDCLGCYCGELNDCCFDPLGLKGWDECLCCCCCKPCG